MTRDEVYAELTAIFHHVFDDERITLSDSMTARDLKPWDSLNHINLIVATEKRFQIRFTTAEVTRMANVGEFVDTILQKTAMR